MKQWIGSAGRKSRPAVFTAVGVVALVGLTGLALAISGTFSSGPSSSYGYRALPSLLPVHTVGNAEGYVPKAYLATPNGAVSDPLLGQVAPVYHEPGGALIGHWYSGFGFFPLGKSPWSRCDGSGRGGSAGAGSCAQIRLPNIAGVPTPRGVGELSGLGVSVVIVDVHSPIVAPGHILSTSPTGGTIVRRGQPVRVSISVG